MFRNVRYEPVFCRREQGVGSKKCGSGKQFIGSAQGACRSANRGTVTLIPGGTREEEQCHRR